MLAKLWKNKYKALDANVKYVIFLESSMVINMNHKNI